MSNPEKSVLTVVVRAVTVEGDGKIISCNVQPDGYIGHGRFVLQVLDVPEQNILVVIAVDMRLLEPRDFHRVVEGASDYIDDVLDNLRLYGYEASLPGMDIWEDAIGKAFDANDDDESESE